MEKPDAKQIVEWSQHVSNEVLRELGGIYKRYTDSIPDTDYNMVYHSILIEMVFYKLFVKMLETTPDEDKDTHMEELIANMRKHRRMARSETAIWDLLQEAQ